MTNVVFEHIQHENSNLINWCILQSANRNGNWVDSTMLPGQKKKESIREIFHAIFPCVIRYATYYMLLFPGWYRFSLRICLQWYFQAYTTNQKLKFHKLTHQGGNQFPCPHCEKILKTPATLQGHIKGEFLVHF